MLTTAVRTRLAATVVALFALTLPVSAANAAKTGWGACGYIDCNPDPEKEQQRQCYYENGEVMICLCWC